MSYFESEIVQIATLAASGAFLFGLLLGFLWGRASARRIAAAPPQVPADRPEAAATQAAAAGAPLDTLPGMSEALASKLAAAGVSDVTALWVRGQDEDALDALCDAVQLEDFALRKWIAIADLSRVEGLAPAHAEALVRIGVRSAAALAAANADRVQHKLAALAEGAAPSAQAPSRATVVAWIERAAAL